MDQRLIAHYFGSKERLFVAAIGFPVDPTVLLPTVFAGDRESLGPRLVTTLLTLLEQPEVRERMTGIIRGAATHPAMARMLREFLTRAVFEPIASALGGDEPQLRANLVGSQIVGLLMARYVVGIEPLASLPARRVAETVAPTLERYLVGPLAAG